VPSNESIDERAAGDDTHSLAARVIQRGSRQRVSNSLAFEAGRDLGMREDDRSITPLVLGCGKLPTKIDLEPVRSFVIDC
jgi:hypothetical protein